MNTKPETASKRECGAVLMTTILMMAIMAVITIAIIDDIRLSITRAANVQAGEQMDWFGRGAESFARNWLSGLLDSQQSALSGMILADQSIGFRIEGGTMTLQIEDARNCFNLNYLASGQTVDVSRQQFSVLLQYMQFDELRVPELAASIQDWVDENSDASPGGAEDYTYTVLDPPYRAANTMMVDITELREINGVTEDIYQWLKPYVCAYKEEGFNVINANTLRMDQAPLLAVVLGGENALLAAQQIIADRPDAGYANGGEIWANPALEQYKLKGAGKEFVRTKTNLVKLNIEIELGGLRRSYFAFFTLGGVGSTKLIARRLEG